MADVGDKTSTAKLACHALERRSEIPVGGDERKVYTTAAPTFLSDRQQETLHLYEQLCGSPSTQIISKRPGMLNGSYRVLGCVGEVGRVGGMGGLCRGLRGGSYVLHESAKILQVVFHPSTASGELKC